MTTVSQRIKEIWSNGPNHFIRFFKGEEHDKSLLIIEKIL